jgi:hypothetical protein
MGGIFPYIMENKKCLKPLTNKIYIIHSSTHTSISFFVQNRDAESPPLIMSTRESIGFPMGFPYLPVSLP